MNLFQLRPLLASLGILLSGIADASPALTAVAANEIDVSPVGRYILTFEEPGLIAYGGDVPGLQRTAPIEFPLASRRPDVDSDAARAYTNYLATRRGEHLHRIEQALGRPVAISHRYEVTRHGVSAAMSHREAKAVARLSGVLSVTPVYVQQPATYRGPAFVGADTIWDGTAVPAYATATLGEGIRVGVIDTGVDGAHPSFANDAACGFDEDNPKLIARDCAQNDGIACTGPAPGPDPHLGHGMHVASTVAGNLIDRNAVPTPTLPQGWQMSGVAPCAAVVSYKACLAAGCYTDMLEAALQNAIADGVDVLNYSIGLTCGGGNPWQGSPDLLAAFTADVAVVAAAGNTADACPNPTGRVTNLGPWVTTVAASTHDRQIGAMFTVAGPGEPSPLLQDIHLDTGSTTLPPGRTEDWFNAPLRTDPDNPRGCTADGAFPPGHFAGAIAVIRRGVCSFAEKITNAVQANASMVIVVNNEFDDFIMDTSGAPPTIAAFSISPLDIADALMQFVGDHPDPLPAEDALFVNGFDPPAGAHGDYRATVEVATQGDVLAGFSLRGPVQAPMENLAKPDITAPGVNVYAASDPLSGHYEFKSGTSMASPHVAGATALMRAVHPDWSIGEVKSALMTTASFDGFKEDGITPWTPEEIGSGRIDLSAAALAGLTLDETRANYLAANPAGGALDIENLNLPSLRNVQCGEQCNWTRVFRSRLDSTGTWSVSADHPAGYTLSFEPATFMLAPGETQAVTITATVNDITLPAELSFGRIRLRELGGLSPDQQLPVAVRGDVVSVECAGGYCMFRIDNFLAGYSAIGCDAFCPFLWANRFSSPASEFPITLTAVSFLTGSASHVAAGDRFDIYVYQDDDRDPTNGAALVGSHKGYTVAAAGAQLRTVILAEPVMLEGPGDVVIALTNPSGTGPRPAGSEVSEFKERSYFGNYVGEDPDLGSAAVGLQLNDRPTTGAANFVIRANGVSADGEAIRLGNPAQK